MRLPRWRLSTMLLTIALVAMSLGCAIPAVRLSDTESRYKQMMVNLETAKRSVVQAEFRREAFEELHSG